MNQTCEACHDDLSTRAMRIDMMSPGLGMWSGSTSWNRNARTNSWQEASGLGLCLGRKSIGEKEKQCDPGNCKLLGATGDRGLVGE